MNCDTARRSTPLDGQQGSRLVVQYIVGCTGTGQRVFELSVLLLRRSAVPRETLSDDYRTHDCVAGRGALLM